MRLASLLHTPPAMKTSALAGIALPLVVIGLALSACAVESAPSANGDDLTDEADEHHDDALPNGYDDGLATSLEDDGDPGDGELGSTAQGLTASPSCDSNARTGDYCAGDKVSSGVKGTLYRCNGPGRATVVKKCSAGCVVNPGRDDSCKLAGPASCPHVSAILKFGLHPTASDRLRCAGITSTRIVQTIGNAAASAGTHAQDGVASGHPYSAATDISVRGLSDAQARTLIARLDALGFAAFFRNPGHDGWPSSEVRHVHAVFAGARMKSSLRSQIGDFLAARNGLASHSTYRFYQAPADVKAEIRRIFEAAN